MINAAKVTHRYCFGDEN